MDEDQAPDQASLFPKSVGDRLREAREAQGKSLADIAGITRVPIHRLEAIEQGRFDGMSPTYAIGFAKTYARAVGLDDKTIAAELRASPQMPLSPSLRFEEYEPTDPKRVPTRGVATVAGLIAIVLLIGVAIWYGTSLFRGSGDELSVPAPDASATVAAAPEATPTPVSGGQVSLTATDAVWLRVYDATGKTLFEKTMQPGERYDVPGDAGNPMINIGRPDKVQVTINGSVVAPLGDGKVAIKDVPVSAAALLARGTPAAAPAPAATPAASATTTSAPSPKPSRSSTVPSAFRDPTPKPTDATPRPVPTLDPAAPAVTATPAP